MTRPPELPILQLRVCPNRSLFPEGEPDKASGSELYLLFFPQTGQAPKIAGPARTLLFAMQKRPC